MLSLKAYLSFFLMLVMLCAFIFHLCFYSSEVAKITEVAATVKLMEQELKRTFIPLDRKEVSILKSSCSTITYNTQSGETEEILLDTSFETSALPSLLFYVYKSSPQKMTYGETACKSLLFSDKIELLLSQKTAHFYASTLLQTNITHGQKESVAKSSFHTIKLLKKRSKKFTPTLESKNLVVDVFQGR